MKKKKIKPIKSEFYNHEIDEWIFEFRHNYKKKSEANDKRLLLGSEVFPRRESDIMNRIEELQKAVAHNPNAEDKWREELRVYQALHKGYGLGWYVALENLSEERSLNEEAKDLKITREELDKIKRKEWQEREDKEIETIFDSKPIDHEKFLKWKDEVSMNADGFWEDDPNTKMKTFIFRNPSPIVQDIPIEKSKWGKESKKKKTLH